MGSGTVYGPLCNIPGTDDYIATESWKYRNGIFSGTRNSELKPPDKPADPAKVLASVVAIIAVVLIFGMKVPVAAVIVGFLLICLIGWLIWLARKLLLAAAIIGFVLLVLFAIFQ
jgi:hypothetical protein